MFSNKPEQKTCSVVNSFKIAHPMAVAPQEATLYTTLLPSHAF